MMSSSRGLFALLLWTFPLLAHAAIPIFDDRISFDEHGRLISRPELLPAAHTPLTDAEPLIGTPPTPPPTPGYADPELSTSASASDPRAVHDLAPDDSAPVCRCDDPRALRRRATRHNAGVLSLSGSLGSTEDEQRLVAEEQRLKDQMKILQEQQKQNLDELRKVRDDLPNGLPSCCRPFRGKFCHYLSWALVVGSFVYCSSPMNSNPLKLTERPIFHHPTPGVIDVDPTNSWTQMTAQTNYRNGDFIRSPGVEWLIKRDGITWRETATEGQIREVVEKAFRAERSQMMDIVRSWDSHSPEKAPRTSIEAVKTQSTEGKLLALFASIAGLTAIAPGDVPKYIAATYRRAANELGTLAAPMPQPVVKMQGRVIIFWQGCCKYCTTTWHAACHVVLCNTYNNHAACGDDEEVPQVLRGFVLSVVFCLVEVESDWTKAPRP